MTRALITAAVAALVSIPVAGRPDDSADDPLVFVLTTTPAAAPVPAMRYEFVPRATERTPDNAALDYARAARLVPPWPADAEERRTLDQTLSRWEDMSAEELPVAEVTAHLAKYAAGFVALDAATFCDHCTWPATKDLEDIMAFRQVVRLNLLRVRRDLARNDFDAAARAIRSGVRLAKYWGERTSPIHFLVGVSFQSMAWHDAVQFVGRPGSPNLYWALAALPCPLIDIRPGLDGEAAALDADLPAVAALERGPVTAVEATRAATKLYAAATTWTVDGPPPELPNGAALAERIAKVTPAARAYLVEHGRTVADVEKLPAAQAVVLAVVHAQRVYREVQYTAFLRPFPQVRPELDRIDRRSAAFRTALGDPLLTDLIAVGKQLGKVYNAGARIDRQVAQLMAVEAVRMHAARDGRPPARLADIMTVPVPLDPYTGQPFEYAAHADGFTLTAPPPAGERAHRGNSVVFKVTFRR